MTKLKIYEYPDPVLKEKAQKVGKVDADILTLLDNMLETMYEANGVGLAAPQVGVLKRMVVIDVEQDEKRNHTNPLFFINPEIVWHSEEMTICAEGCLSIPKQSADVERYEQVRVKYTNREGKEEEITADGFLSIALQHELDHLDGILYIDHISRLKRNMLLKKLKKMREEEKE